MATTKKSKTQEPIIDELTIIEHYMIDVLENNGNTRNVYLFCKSHDISEVTFYTFFASLDAVKNEIWLKFFENAVDTITKEPDYANYSDKNKLLTLYFTLFEILTLNRSYVVYTLQHNKNMLHSLSQLKQFRNRFKDFIVSIIDSGTSATGERVSKVTKPVFSEGAWIQFLFILKFWLDDTSKGFEKTDIVIEKSVNTAVDLLDIKPLENLFDLGKFLWKERQMR